MKLKKTDPEVKLGKTILDFSFPINNWFRMFLNVVAVMVSWYFNKSIIWAIVHWIFGPLYLLYSLLNGRFTNGSIIDIFNSYF